MSRRRMCAPGARASSRAGSVTLDAVMASACLPQLYPAVEIDGEAYWDGGYSANPALMPLVQPPAPTS
jgi:NTE family protein